MRLLLSAVIWEKYLRSGMCQIELVPLADKYGCAGIEFRPFWRSALAELPEIKGFIAEYGLVAAYSCSEALCGPDPDEIRTSLQAMVNSIVMAEFLGAPVLKINVANRPFAPEITQEDWWTRAVLEVLGIAASKGVVLAAENAREGPGSDPEFLCRLAEHFGAAGLKLAFDTGNWARAGRDPSAAMEKLFPYISYVHLKDVAARSVNAPTVMPGAGVADVAGIMRRLIAKGYDGMFATVFPGGSSPALAVRAGLKYLRGE